jgi:hypothetical protein
VIQEIAHLGRHVAEAGGRAEDDGVRVGQVIDGRYRHMGELISRRFGP